MYAYCHKCGKPYPASLPACGFCMAANAQKSSFVFRRFARAAVIGASLAGLAALAAFLGRMFG